ncbi:leucine zipper putative tumor suppressor 2 homolog isoform X2 [Panonychus citri]|uniref:leucine zipper putative tumor suppressor 2 homolog isoform X2 n=1 Tax=Panonychus citri TaxID=50023 RepID=UPI0023075B2C|nr:leucine zipper putative tumor suppressor 2 homolog isoform X2 [Panonychus citri]
MFYQLPLLWTFNSSEFVDFFIIDIMFFSLLIVILFVVTLICLCVAFRKVLKPVAYKLGIGTSNGQVMSPVQLKHASQISYTSVQTASVQSPQPQTQPSPSSLPTSQVPISVLTNTNTNTNNNNNNNNIIIHQQTSQQQQQQHHHHKQLSIINTSQPLNPHHHLTLSSHHHNHSNNHSHHHSHHLHNDYVHTPRNDGSVYSSPFSSIDSETDSGKLIVNGLNRVETLTTKSNLSQSQASLSHCSGLPGDDDHWYLDPPPPPSSVLKMPPLNWDLTSLTAARRRPLMYNSSDYLSQTPSPNDSVIVELEALLREKDSEISYLRETLERNEQVIFKVYEEKGQSWEREFKKLKSQYELNLKNYQQRAIRAEQMISLQNKQNQVDREMIEQNYESTRKKVESLESENAGLKNELTNVKKMVDELKWTLCERNGEIGLLKTSIRDSKVDLSYRSTELVSLRDKLAETNESMEESKYKVNNLEKELAACQDHCNLQIQSMGERLADLVKQLDEKNRCYDTLINEKRELQSQVINLKSQLTLEQNKFTKEKETWADEKEKVLRYQRQLQSNYKKMLNANKIFHDLANIIRTKELTKPEESSC